MLTLQTTFPTEHTNKEIAIATASQNLYRIEDILDRRKFTREIQDIQATQENDGFFITIITQYEYSDQEMENNIFQRHNLSQYTTHTTII